MSWYRDKNLLTALFVGLVLRTLPLLVWGWQWVCTRDECTYIRLAKRMANGDGMTSSSGWLWAPGYPALMAVHKAVFGWASAIRGTQVVVALIVTILLWYLGQRIARMWTRDQPTILRAGRIAAWMYAASLPQAFFAMSMWSEVIYTLLLLVALLALHAAAPPPDEGVPEAERVPLGERPLVRALGYGALVGAMVGGCVLFRGVATYMLPIFIVGLLWRRWRAPRAWGQVAALLVAAVVVVAPYSTYASAKFDGFVVSDRTLGRMMWLGNNDFEPLTFDCGNGQLSSRAYERTQDKGRPNCASKRDVMALDQCSRDEGVQWIKDNPEEFVRRMPMRVAQLVNPHSLLTRHLRWGRWPGLPQWVDELSILWGAGLSMVTMWVGALGLCARGRRGLGLVTAGILSYHVLAISFLAGLTRYRIPLEPLLLLYAAQILASPRASLAILKQRPWRLAAAVVILAMGVPLVLWYLPAGWPGWRTW